MWKKITIDETDGKGGCEPDCAGTAKRRSRSSTYRSILL